MGETFDFLIAPFKETYNLLKKDYKGLGIDFTKIYVLTFLTWIVLILAIGALALSSAFFVDSYLKDSVFIASSVFGVAIFLIAMVITSALSGVFYSVIHGKLAGRKISIIDKTKELIAPMGRYVIVIMLIYVLPLLGIIATMLLARGLASSMAEIVILVLGIVVIAPIYLILAFLLQFAVPEIVLNKRGVIDSLKQSYALVRKNLLVTFGFDIVLVLVTFAIAAVFRLISSIIGFFAVVSIVIFPLLILIILAIILLTLVQAMVTSMLITPAQYYFWKSIGGMGAKRK